MKLFLIRLLVIALFALIFTFVVIKADFVTAVFLGFVCEYIIEPPIVEKLK